MVKETHPETKKLQSLFLMAVWELCKDKCVKEIEGRSCPLKQID